MRDAWKAIQEDHPQAGNLQAELNTLGQMQKLTFPNKAALILPTRFGSVIRGSETYPAAQYGIDGVLFWRSLTAAAGKEVLAAAGFWSTAWPAARAGYFDSMRMP